VFLVLIRRNNRCGLRSYICSRHVERSRDIPLRKLKMIPRVPPVRSVSVGMTVIARAQISDSLLVYRRTTG
jgi:hypothetical protein